MLKKKKKTNKNQKQKKNIVEPPKRLQYQHLVGEQQKTHIKNTKKHTKENRAKMTGEKKYFVYIIALSSREVVHDLVVSLRRVIPKNLLDFLSEADVVLLSSIRNPQPT